MGLKDDPRNQDYSAHSSRRLCFSVTSGFLLGSSLLPLTGDDAILNHHQSASGRGGSTFYGFEDGYAIRR